MHLPVSGVTRPWPHLRGSGVARAGQRKQKRCTGGAGGARFRARTRCGHRPWRRHRGRAHRTGAVAGPGPHAGLLPDRRCYLPRRGVRHRQPDPEPALRAGPGRCAHQRHGPGPGPLRRASRPRPGREGPGRRHHLGAADVVCDHPGAARGGDRRHCGADRLAAHPCQPQRPLRSVRGGGRHRPHPGRLRPAGPVLRPLGRAVRTAAVVSSLRRPLHRPRRLQPGASLPATSPSCR